MKRLILVFIVATLLVSCDNKQAEQQSAPTTEVPQAKKPENKKVNSSDVFSAAELDLLAGDNSAKKGGKRNSVSQTITQATTSATLTNNGGGSFSIDYGGATNVVWMFFRGSDSLAANGNVYPTASQSFYLNPVTTFTSNFTRLFYQAVVVTGSTTPDVNGVVGADWVFTYSNVVNN